ncbi:MAG TPA: hypothetical protein VER78_01675, partial [Thermoanaerobaculia bacterium]|nr:hypothetical protein [Thermoanaerobaculia bacterium]
MPTEAPVRRATISFWKRWRSPREEGTLLPPVVLAVAYVLATTFSYAPSLSFRRAPVRAGAIAVRDVVAPRDLIVPDAAATARRKTEASAEVPPVYDWDAGAGARLENELRNSFRKAREVWATSRRRGALSPMLREAFELPVKDEALAALVRLSFSPELENELVTVVSDIYRGGVVDNRDLLLENRAPILLRDTASSREVRRRDLSEVIEYGSPVRAALTSRLSGGQLNAREAAEIAAFLAPALRPNLTSNAAETARRREEAARSIEIVLTKIPRGKVIVRRGDEISPRAAEI